MSDVVDEIVLDDMKQCLFEGRNKQECIDEVVDKHKLNEEQKDVLMVVIEKGEI